MSGVRTRMDRTTAIAIAKQVVAEIEPYTTQLIVAGSLRRRLAFVGDIELCAVPKVETVETEVPDLFGGQKHTDTVDLLDATMTMLLDKGRVERRRKADGSLMGWGPRSKYVTFNGARVDLFCAVNDWDKEQAQAEPDRFGWLLVLRTGPYKFSKQLVVAKGKRTNDGRPGLMPPHLISEGGWLRYRTSRETIPTSDERSVFDLFQIPYVEPWERV